ncbi:tRNA-intron endonuclease [Fistulina hepatica ATCC 64428]|uniref:tRNA-splicing endonuclease subunit Sen2 n=1 Tax=Fistulina hepatica ATCC 64428 TaxID=1128425 RepID=A0A0D7ALY6_9AGAR|nr:tRNA-intron endonuclease [Fistulina hepatica ATCC 64428]
MTMIAPNPGRKGPYKGGARRQENNRIYGNPLPLRFVDTTPKPLRSVLGLLGLSLAKVDNPHCEGVFDVASRSVWVSDRHHAMLLWRRGFFGKGHLSRSEPSWLARQINAREAARKNQMTSEEVTAKRRAERKQFKLDRARAIAAVAAEAEAAFEREGRVTVPALSGPNIPSAATWKPSSPVRETTGEGEGPEQALLDEDQLVDVEHLQLTLPEAFFLSWGLDCLTISSTNATMNLSTIWTSFQRAHLRHNPDAPLQFDNPFIVHYVVYHHYRSLGWVVRGGIKFCVDYLLYKRGPVFTHAEFALVICPVYEDPADQETSCVNLQNSTPFSWTWLSTINRVNSQVMKTLVLVYVTIPARSRLPTHILDSPACLAHYSVREVILRRFLPARMRD